MPDPAPEPPADILPDASAGAETDDGTFYDPTLAPCRHLHNKEMFVWTDPDPNDPHGDNESTAFWCTVTMKGFGPDDGFVGRIDCRDASRSCYEPN